MDPQHHNHLNCSILENFVIQSFRWLFACLLLLLLVASCSSESKVAQAIQRGEELIKEGNRSEAILNFKKAIQLNSNSGEAYYGLGRAFFTPDNVPEAYASLSRAAELLPARADVQEELGDAALTLYLATPSRPAPLREHLIKISDTLAKTTPNSSSSFRFRAYVQMADQRAAEAVQTLQQGLKVNPNEPRSNLALVKALLLDSRVEEADAAALRAIAQNPQYTPLYDVMIDHLLRSKTGSSRAEHFLRLKVSNNPGSADALLGLARFHRIRQDSEALVATLAPLLQDAKRFPMGHLQAADFYVETAAYGPAEKTLRQAIASQPSIRDAARIRLARVLFLYQRADEAFSLADELAKEKPADREIVILRADLAALGKRPDRYDPAISEIRAILPKFPDDASLHSALGEVLLRKGDLDGAAKEFEQTAKSDVTNTTARVALVNIYLQKKNHNAALQQVNQLLAADPSNLGYRLLLVTSLRTQGNFGEARSELTKLSSEFPNQQGVLLELGSLHLAEGRTSQAEAVFKRLYSPDRPNLQVLEGLARSLVAQNQVDRAMELLLSVQQKAPSLELSLLIADVAFSARRFDHSVRFFSLADTETKLSAEVLGRYAEALQRTGDLPQAITIARRARDLEPKTIQLSVFLAFLLQVAGQGDEAVALYRTVLKSQPSHLQAANNLAYLLAEQGKDLPEANQLASRCVRDRPEDDGFLDTLGMVLYKQGQFSEAIDVFQRALKKNPAQGSYRYHLALALLAKGERSQAKRELQQALAQIGDPAEKTRVQELLKSMA